MTIDVMTVFFSPVGTLAETESLRRGGGGQWILAIDNHFSSIPHPNLLDQDRSAGILIALSVLYVCFESW